MSDDEEAVEPQVNEPIEQILDDAQAEVPVHEDADSEQNHEKTMIPLSVAQKLREKKKELELELQWERQERQRLMQSQSVQAPPEDDNSKYESATREDVLNAQDQAVRMIEERLWIRSNPDKYEKINEFLPQFLKQRPNLASAINSAQNRYEEAFTLMEALTPKQQQQIVKSAAPKKEAPNSPSSVPKGASLNQSIDVMNMSDDEFSKWRQEQKRRR